MGERPDIKIPINHRIELERLVTREFSSWCELKTDPDPEVAGETAQCLRNYDNLLDHWPDGKQRPEVSVEQANEAILRLGQRAIAA